MARVFIGALAAVLICGQARAQVAAPPDSLRQEQPVKPVPRAGPRPRPVAPPIVHEPRPKIQIAGTGQRVDLNPKWTTGDIARYDFEFLNHWVARPPDDASPKKGGQLYRQEGRLARRVLAVNDSGVTLSITIERLHMQVSSGTEVIHYDSDFGDIPERQNELTAPVKACVGRAITVRLNKSGEVIGIEGNENPNPDPGKPAPPQIPQAILGNQVIRKVWRPLYTLEKGFPDSHIGDKWTTEELTPDPSMGTYALTLHHELTGLKDGVAMITTIADVDFTPLIGHGVVHAALTSSAVTGAVAWDTSRGILRSWATSQDMKLDAEKAGEHQRLETKLTTSFKWFDPNAPKETPGTPADSGKPVAPVEPGKSR